MKKAPHLVNFHPFLHGNQNLWNCPGRSLLPPARAKSLFLLRIATHRNPNQSECNAPLGIEQHRSCTKTTMPCAEPKQGSILLAFCIALAHARRCANAERWQAFSSVARRAPALLAAAAVPTAGFRAGFKAWFKAGSRAGSKAGYRAEFRAVFRAWFRAGSRAGFRAGFRAWFRAGFRAGFRAWFWAGFAMVFQRPAA